MEQTSLYHTTDLAQNNHLQEALLGGDGFLDNALPVDKNANDACLVTIAGHVGA